MSNNNRNLNDSEIGIVVNKDTPTQAPVASRSNNERPEIHYINIDSHIKFIDRVFSIKEHHDRSVSTESSL